MDKLNQAALSKLYKAITPTPAEHKEADENSPTCFMLSIWLQTDCISHMSTSAVLSCEDISLTSLPASRMICWKVRAIWKSIYAKNMWGHLTVRGRVWDQNKFYAARGHRGDICVHTLQVCPLSISDSLPPRIFSASIILYRPTMRFLPWRFGWSGAV